LLAAGIDPAHAREAAEMVRGWEDRGHAGLPIGPAASAAIADAVLIPVDEALAGRPFLRWVDDYLVGVSSEEDAERTASRIDERLAMLGLVRSDAKTGFLPRGALGAWPGSLSQGADEEAVSRRGARGAAGDAPPAEPGGG
jgi:hypothetical protein